MNIIFLKLSKGNHVDKNYSYIILNIFHELQDPAEIIKNLISVNCYHLINIYK